MEIICEHSQREVITTDGLVISQCTICGQELACFSAEDIGLITEEEYEGYK